MTPEEFRAAGHRLIDWIADHRAGIEQLPVRSGVEPGWVRSQLDAPPPAAPDALDDLLGDLDRVVVPGLTHFQHPSFFGFFPANASLASVLGDLTSGGLGALGLSWEAAPALTELEEVVCAWFAAMAGLGDPWRGTICDTASTATLLALIAAREAATSAGTGAPVVVCSDQAHSSVVKAARLAGYGHDGVEVLCPTGATGWALDPSTVDEALARAVATGHRPAALVATIGTTGTTAVDPVAELVPVARRYDCWLHVDAAMAGSAVLLEEMSPLFAGLDGADSFSMNPHKWLGTAFDTSLLYVRRPERLTSVMSSAASYLRAPDGEVVTQYRDWGIPLGRRFRALKLWFHLRLDGLDAIRARLRRDLAHAEWLEAAVRGEPGWEVVAPRRLQTVCVRHVPARLGDSDAGAAASQLDDHTLGWVGHLNASGAAYLTPAQLEGRWMARVSIGAETTERRHVEALWAAMREAVRATSAAS